jgi:hypothetical protein
MSDPINYSGHYPEDKKDLEPAYDIEGLDSDGEAKSFTALIQEGENRVHAIQHRTFRPFSNIRIYTDHSHDIKLRTMSWQKAAWLLAGDQVCLAIMAQTWSLSYVHLRLKFKNRKTNMNLQCLGMGSWPYHHGWSWYPFLDHIHYHAPVHYEKSSNPGYL